MKAIWHGRVFVCGVLALTAMALPASERAVHIELQCKIVASQDQDLEQPQSWLVEIKGTASTIVRTAHALEGQTVHFRDLDPGIYTTCLLGSFNRIHCESVDLNPPAGSKFFSILRQLKIPQSALNQDDSGKVSVSQLLVPKTAQQELDMARTAEIEGKDAEIVRHLEAAIKIDPEYSAALNELGIFYHKHHEYEKAIGCFIRATQLTPDYYGGWTNLSGSLMAASRFEEALDASTSAYRLRPHEPLVLACYARCLYYLQKYSDAKKYFEAVADLDPQNASYPQLYLAQIALGEGDIVKAQQWVSSFLHLHPNLPETFRYAQFFADLARLK